MKSNEFSVGSPMKSVAQAETVTKVAPVLQTQADQSVQAETKQSAQQRSSGFSASPETDQVSSSSSEGVEATYEQTSARSSVQQKVESSFSDALHRQTSEAVTAEASRHTEMSNPDVKPVASQLSQPTQSTATGVVRETGVSQQPYALPAEESVMQQVVTQVKQQGAHSSEMQVKLVPEQLGTVRMSVGVEDGIVRARIVTETNEARSLLERNLNELKVALGDQGFRVQEVKLVTAGGGESSLSAFDGNGSSQRQNLSQSHQQPSYQGSSSGNQSGRTLGDSEQSQPSLRHWESLSQPGQGRVDYRV